MSLYSLSIEINLSLVLNLNIGITNNYSKYILQNI